MLRGQGLCRSFRAPSGSSIAVLDGVDLAVGAGELAVVTGVSGSGKTTLLNVLGLLEEPTAGAVFYAGQRVTGLSRSRASRARGQTIGFVFQSFLLLPSLTALENVLLAARYVRRRGPGTRRRAEALLAELGVEARRDHYPTQLSGGEQQRVAFCRAVLNDPPVLLADEPTGNLDDAHAAVILSALRARLASGAAVVVVTHRPELLGGARTVYRLEAGRLIEEGR